MLRSLCITGLLAGTLLVSPLASATYEYRIDVEKLTNGFDADEPDSPKAQIAPGDTVTWTYIVTNQGTSEMFDIVLYDDILGQITCPRTVLAGGIDDSMICTATGIAEKLAYGPPHVVEGTCGEDGSLKPVYRNEAEVFGYYEPKHFPGHTWEAGDIDVSHYCNPPDLPPDCSTSLTKTCTVPPPPPVSFDKCDGKLQQFTLQWPANESALTLTGGLASDDADGVIQPGQLVTFFNTADGNDVSVFTHRGESMFHLSCSDPDMNDPSDCDKLQGDGKSNAAGLLNAWRLAGFVDAKGRQLQCPQFAPPTADNSDCEVGPFEPVSCETAGKPSTFSFRYVGAGPVSDCTDNAATRANSKVPACSGNLAPGATVSVSVNSGTVTPATVAPGEEFALSGFGSNTVITLSANGQIETLAFHTSCSAPLEVGDRFGNLELTAFDSRREDVPVTFEYRASNSGPDPALISIVDDVLGPIVSDHALAGTAPGNTQVFRRTVPIGGPPRTIVNTATLSQTGPDNGIAIACAQATATLKVLAPPPCNVTGKLYKIEDDKIKWKLTNLGNRTATIQSIEFHAPGAFGSVKKIRFDGDIFKDQTRPTDWTFTANDFVSELKKRQIKAGANQDLEIEFTSKYKSATPADFQVTITFEEGCSLSF